MARLAWVSAFALVMALTGCDDDGGGGVDAGPGGGMDSGPGGDTDAGPGGDTDAGPGGDTDAGPGGDTDAGPGGDTDAGPGDAGPGGMNMGVVCGMDVCDSTEQCCTSGIGIGGMMSSTCIPAGDMCMGASQTCDGPEDCASGEVCCGRRDGLSINLACVAAAMCDGDGLRGPYELCRDASDCSTMGDMCCPAMFIPGIDGFCAAMCGGIGPGTP